MATGREIRTKIKSIKNTQKITRAMELVAASKMRKAQNRMHTSRPYSKMIRRVIAHVAASHSEYHHPYLKPRENPDNVGFIVVSTDRGLCGGLNVNLFKTLILEMVKWQQKKVGIYSCSIGIKASHLFKRYGSRVIAEASHLGDAPSINAIIGVVRAMLDAYDAEKVDVLYLVYNEFVNTMTQKPVVVQLLPIEEIETDVKAKYWDYIYEPDAKELLDVLLVRYIESQVYQAVVENIACEQAARMVAMKNATENANEIINELQLIYNKERQAMITQEIAEICSGAAAV